MPFGFLGLAWDSATAAAIGLIVVTAGLVWYTRGLMLESARGRDEMRATRDEMIEGRRLTVRPHLSLEVDAVSGLIGFLAIRNLGPGSAVDVALEIRFDPLGEVRSWQWPSIPAGIKHQFLLPEEVNHNLEEATARGLTARASGSCADVYGNRYPMDQSFDFAEWWTATKAASQRAPTPLDERIARRSRRSRKKWELSAGKPGSLAVVQRPKLCAGVQAALNAALSRRSISVLRKRRTVLDTR